MTVITYGITASQLLDVEAMVAHWRAFVKLEPVRSIDEAQAFNDLDEQADRVAVVCREVRRQGS